MDKTVFISYDHEDQEFVDELENGLTKLGINYFLDKKDIEWGEDINKNIKQALKECTATILIISQNSLNSPWVLLEIGQAIALNKKILPVLTDPSLILPTFLQNISYKKNIKEAIDSLSSIFNINEGHKQLYVVIMSDNKIRKINAELPLTSPWQDIVYCACVAAGLPQVPNDYKLFDLEENKWLDKKEKVGYYKTNRIALIHNKMAALHNNNEEIFKMILNLSNR